MFWGLFRYFVTQGLCKFLRSWPKLSYLLKRIREVAGSLVYIGSRRNGRAEWLAVSFYWTVHGINMIAEFNLIVSNQENVVIKLRQEIWKRFSVLETRCLDSKRRSWQVCLCWVPSKSRKLDHWICHMSLFAWDSSRNSRNFCIVITIFGGKFSWTMMQSYWYFLIYY